MLGNCPNLAKILFVQRVTLLGQHVYFRSNYIGCPWPGPGRGPAGSRGTPLLSLAGKDGNEGAGKKASGCLPGEHAPSSARSIPTSPGEQGGPGDPAPHPRACPHLPRGVIRLVSAPCRAFREGILIISLFSAQDRETWEQLEACRYFTERVINNNNKRGPRTPKVLVTSLLPPNSEPDSDIAFKIL